MHVHFLDPYRPRPSLIHELDPRVKLVVTLAFILTTALVPTGAWPVYILLLAFIYSVELLSELGISYVLKRAILALPFVLAAFPVIFTMAGPAIFQFEIGKWVFTASLTGLERFISVALKSWISVQAAIVLASSTSFPDLLLAMRAIRIPRLLVAIFGLMWRYLFVLADEAIRLMRARASRSGSKDPANRKSGGSLAWRARVTGGMAGNLFLRGFERSDRIYNAMLSRGYDGEVRALPLPQLRPAHGLIVGTALVIFACLLIVSFLVWG
jgi:cobalt/nickel transport system permease protein